MELDNVLPCRKFAFSIGHFLNDLCASVWFSYSLVFYHRVAKFSNSSAGYLLLIGQVADALSTTFIGFASDRTKHGLCGKRKSWHLLGLQVHYLTKIKDFNIYRSTLCTFFLSILFSITINRFIFIYLLYNLYNNISIWLGMFTNWTFINVK
jgi:Na+/melibiose symporter-like transporter